MMLGLALACADPAAPDDGTPPADDTGQVDDSTDHETAETGTDSDTGPDGSATPVTVTDFTLELGDPGTLVWAHWKANGPTFDTTLAYSFDDGDWLTTPLRDRDAGDQREVLLGIPAASTVDVYLTASVDDAAWQSETLTITTDDAPPDLVAPVTVVHDPVLASPERWLLGSIDVSAGAWFDGPFYVFLMDRAGRYVWWRKIEDRRSMFAQVGATGDYLAVDASSVLDPDASEVYRFTLDGEREESIALPGFVWSFDEGPDGTIFYDARTSLDGPLLMERASDGTTRTIWGCAVDYGLLCSTNTVKHDADRDTILWSMYDLGAVVEIDRASGAVVRQFGELPGSWSFDPDDIGFRDQHWPNYTAEGTLLVSTHLPDAPKEQRAFELEVDDATQTLRLVWSYGEGVDEYAYYAGEATRLANGNTLLNYGTGGALREITDDGTVVFEVDWGYIYPLGHNELLDDLYAFVVPAEL